MPLSSNSFFHFTSGGFNALTGILTNGFKVSVSHEITYNSAPSKTMLGIPMVCLCDIPLSLVHRHANHFCSHNVFGIGMTRTWGERKLSPVQYYPRQQDFYFAENLNYLSDLVLTNRKLLTDTRIDRNFDAVAEMLEGDCFFINSGGTPKYLNWLTGLIKPVRSDYYKFDLQSKSIVLAHKEYSFYDEREWRYIGRGQQPLNFPIPYYSEQPFPIIDIDVYIKCSEDLKMHYASEPEYLGFCADEITWIIVDTEASVRELICKINDLDKIGGISAGSIDRYAIIQKIVSYERLQSDMSSF